MKKYIQSFTLLCVIIGFVLLCAPKKTSNPTESIVNNPAPRFILNNDSGGTTRLSDYNGSVILLMFGEDGNTPTQNAAPHIETIYNEYRSNNVRVLCILVKNTVGGNPTVTELSAFKTTHALTFPVLADENQKTKKSYTGSENPLIFYVLDRQLHIKTHYTGYSSQIDTNIRRDIVNLK